MAKILYYAVILFTIFTVKVTIANQCIEENPCLCKLDAYTEINLAGLLSSVSNLDKGFVQDSKGNLTYFLSGCKDNKFVPKDYNLNSNETITGSLIKCLTNITTFLSKNSTVTTIIHNCSSIGKAEQIKFDVKSDTSNNYQIVYNVKSNKDKPLPSVSLVCDQFNRTDLKIVNEESDELVLYSPVVCVKHFEHHELSTGSLFCIIFLSAFASYFIIGACISYFVIGARGVEIIPNIDFWTSIPGLVKDGTIFILSGCRPFTVSTAETYDRI